SEQDLQDEHEVNGENEDEEECSCHFKSLSLTYIEQENSCPLSCEDLVKNLRLELIEDDQGEINLDDFDDDNSRSCLEESLGVVNLINISDPEASKDVCDYLESN
ncbi:hypothetical protein N9N67_11705, partial [Bacteriovoracaceae bacterium]|nr:hypothetical protein [Bacteriovoracaceae bacterium]